MATARKSPRRRGNQPNEELISELRTWASATRSTNDPYVKSLLNSLETFEDIQAIAETNPLDYLPTPEFRAGERRLKLNNILTIVRNVLVFAPVALTWLAVSKATTAFAEFTKANTDAVVNFLEFWQDGYGVLSSEWTIGHVGFLDFLIILIVIALTLITALMTDRHQREQTTQVAKLDNQRIELGIKLHAYLFTQRKVTPDAVNASVSAAARSLQATSKAMAQASKELAKDIKKLPKS